MNVSELTCRALREKPETRRASRKMGKPLDLKDIVGMGLNENVYGMSKKTEKAMLEANKTSYRYGDFKAYDLKEAIADEFSLGIENVITSAGSSAIINTIGTTFLEEGDELLTCIPTFQAFSDTAYENMAVPINLELTDDHKFDLDGLLERISEKTKMIVICNPNNPTGTYVSESELRKFFEQVPENIVVVMDEAYIEFATATDCVSAVGLMKEFPQKAIIILRTFSKYYGMAGVRVGYALAAPELVAAMMKCSGVWNLSKAAQAGAIEALKDKEYGEYVREEVTKSREYLQEQLKEMGCDVYDSQTNFVYFDTHKETSQVFQELIKLGIMTSGGHQYNRVTVGTKEECRKFIECMKVIMAS